ncbi:MAG: caspase family protein [Xenococcaceae cyanobacterium]
MATKNRYYLIACGTSDYDNYEQLDYVKDDIVRITKLFTEKFGYERVLLSLNINPDRRKFTDYKADSFADWLEKEERQENDIVVFYYSGHGLNPKGDQHYLALKETVPNREYQTAFATKELVYPLRNKKVKISQILFIIDTCHSQGGASDLVNLASQLLGDSEKVAGKNIDVHVIAACRTKQLATDGSFSKAFVKALEELSEDLQQGYIDPSKIVPKINELLDSEEQKAKCNAAFCEQEVKFFPFVPRTIQNWEQKCHQLVKDLAQILNKEPKLSFRAINYFLLSCNFIKELLINEQEIEEKLSELSEKGVVDEVCPLIACAEWCRKKFVDEELPNIASEIKTWQQEAIKYREDGNLAEIRDFIKNAFDEFKQIIKKEKLRILVEIEPELDGNGTGLSTGNFYLNLFLWISSQNIPIAKFAEKEFLALTEIEDQELEECLRDTLAQENLLVKLIRQARYSLPPPVTLDVEFLLPFELFCVPVEKLTFKSGRKKKPIGEEYSLFINSYERYYHRDYREIRDNLRLKREEFWEKAKELAEDKFYFSGSQVPSTEDLEEIEESHSIAIWTRSEKHSIELGKDLKRSEWKEWSQKIQQLRKKNKNLEITLFWDDMFPKPRPKKLLSTDLVE